MVDILHNNLTSKIMYLYKTTIYKETADIVGIDATQEGANKTDFETNFKSQAIAVDDVAIAETTFITDLSYSDFKAIIVSPIGWADVKYVSNGKYILHVTSSISL